MKFFCIFWGCVGLLVLWTVPVWASTPEIVEAVHWLDASMEVRYSVEESSANIEREYKCSGDPNRCPSAPEVVTVSELQATRSRQSIWLDGRFGVGDFELQIAAPYVLQDIRRVSFADGVGLSNTTLFEMVGDEKVELFNRDNAPKRRGIGDLTVGLRAAILSLDPAQAQPDLNIRAQYTAPSSPTMDAENLAVGEGLHQVLFGLETGYSISESVVAHLDASAKLRFAADENLYLTGFRTQHLQHPGAQFHAGTTLTFTPWAPAKAARFFTVAVGGDLLFTDSGREPTMLFDALAFSRCSMLPDCGATDYYVPSVVGLEPRGSVSNGVTDVQEHLRVAGTLELRYRPSEHIEVFAGASVAFTPAYFLTFARAGVNVDGKGTLTNMDEIYQQSEFNPVYVEALDKTGSRLLASGTVEFSGFLSTAYRY